ncbi:MAG TPA: alpha-glucosidase C-terminal domain-containing protein, partial [Terriglobia bacterium]|nr:alpha-glucosidase C-terminal domain-containing protein [Terriglobia bacterium]
YYGDEIGMGDNIFLGDRNGVRTPMQWNSDRNAGFSRANPQRLDLPVIVDPEYHYEAVNVEAQQSNPNSLLWWTKRMIALRKRHRAFGRGSVEFLTVSNPSVFGFIRRYHDDVILVIANLSRRVQYAEIDLSAMKGQIPTELMGQTAFPVIGDAPYVLTLGGYDFYWFKVDTRFRATTAASEPFAAPTMSITTPDEFMSGTEPAQLEEVLRTFLSNRGWFTGSVSTVRIIETSQIRNTTSATMVFMNVEFADAKPESLMLPVIAIPFDPDLAQFETSLTSGVALIANLYTRNRQAEAPDFMLLLASREGAGRIILEAIGKGASFHTRNGRIVAEKVPGVTLDLDGALEARVLSGDPLAGTVAYGTKFVLRVFYRSEGGTAPEIEIARCLEQQNLPGYVPRVLGWIEHRIPNREPVTLGILEEQIANQGTAWQQACGEVERAYERALARAVQEPPDPVPARSLIELTDIEPPEAHKQMIGGYGAWAAKLGSRVAGFHLALASSSDPAFEPRAYSALDQRSKYQTARNLLGRAFGLLRDSLNDLSLPTRETAARVLALESDILERFESLRTQPIDAKRIRIHGNLHLGRALFTGKDFVLLGAGAYRRRLSERKRKASAFRDVASIVRSYRYAAALSLQSLRMEDQSRAEPWGRLWSRWMAASFVRSYLETAGHAPFISQNPAITTSLLETALLDQALRDLQYELRRHSARVVIPLCGIVDILYKDSGLNTTAADPSYRPEPVR